MATHFVTGATSGIGEALAHALHQRGDTLVLLARSDDRAGTLRETFPGCTTLVADLGDPGQVGAAVAAAADLPESLDSVVHAAGVVDVAPVERTDPGSLADTVTVDLLAPMLLTRALLGPVRAARGTHVFVNSGSGLRANPGWASYNAAKFGLRGFADALRQEEASHGVRVTSVYPGRTATPMQQKVHAQEGREYDAGQWIRPGTVVEQVLAVLDLGADATIPDLVIRPRG